MKNDARGLWELDGLVDGHVEEHRLEPGKRGLVKPAVEVLNGHGDLQGSCSSPLLQEHLFGITKRVLGLFLVPNFGRPQPQLHSMRSEDLEDRQVAIPLHSVEETRGELGGVRGRIIPPVAPRDASREVKVGARAKYLPGCPHD